MEIKKVGQIKTIFFTVPIYDLDVLIMVGAKTKTDVMRVLKKNRVNAEVTKTWDESEDMDLVLKSSAGSIVDDNVLAIIYVFKEWNNTNRDHEVLVHELSHMMDSISKHKNLKHDIEGRAYLQEYLYKSIRIGMNAKVR